MIDDGWEKQKKGGFVATMRDEGQSSMKRAGVATGVIIAAGTLVAVASATGLLLGGLFAPPFDTFQDARVRVPVQRWADSQGLFRPDTEIDAFVQFNNCATYSVTLPGREPVGVVAVNDGKGWMVSATSSPNGIDDIDSEGECRELYRIH
ncbi:hypothetical protein [Dermatophilus congolensis]|uniref:hypothetical protein n=1 Tax=Dermatophilus congolensis TaxID=1863 RepID=UPI001AAE6DB6|nr:hypothetical protein [Dermatophilus congolensis]MBO3143741.1 hypothetical protein [Dermatophilus congolensis]MBO3152732.1 hypothetical protein [Dermatophilus congolensis]MBO3160257.1 hypothetical protein [Dermatophilus congolensis]MBO3164017.1 hypothetical protein [Dermatophilus congolensis]MBO3177562.1 hypothetical protein [Dermatophilus congolensis]